MPKLTQKVALVTGGSRGIGAAIAKRLASDGASVAITYAKDASAASAVVKAIERDGGKAIAIQADAADAEAVKSAIEQAVATFGRLDVLVNNAGTAIPKPFEQSTLDEIDRMFNINVRGTMVATQAALKHMKSGGRIGAFRVCDGHVRSVRSQTLGDRGTNAARAARNECNLSFQFLRHLVFSYSSNLALCRSSRVCRASSGAA